MLEDHLCETAIGSGDFAPKSWMKPSALRCLVEGDPSQLWLEHHGAAHGFTQDDIAQTLTGFILQKGNEYEAAWINALAPDAVRVCEGPWDSVNPDKVRETFALMQQKTPVITQAALCCAGESIYGIADLLVHTHWLRDRSLSLGQNTPREPAEGEGHYVALDIKFSTRLDSKDADKRLNWLYISSQLRLYTYMLGRMQGHMPGFGYVIARDRVKAPLPVPIKSHTLDAPLDEDLAELRAKYQDIVLEGANYNPWTNECVFVNDFNDPAWKTAKKAIAEKIAGRARELCHEISPKRRQSLTALGFFSLQDMLDKHITEAQLQTIGGLGANKARQIFTILTANRTQQPSFPDQKPAPAKRQCELYVDTEYFSNLNVDFRQVDFTQDNPEMKGCEMIFMLGVGWENASGGWEFQRFLADAQEKASEKKLLDEFCAFLSSHGCSCEADHTVLYHWTADATKVKGAARAHEYAAGHLLHDIPWEDLHKHFTGTPIGIPGAWGYGLKELGLALTAHDPTYPIAWPMTLSDGANAMVQGWQAYAEPNPVESDTMQTLIPYLESDCHALYQITRWLRS